MEPETGTLLVALSNGFIQVWSHHSFGGYIEKFKGIHTLGDCVMAMTTDKENKFLFTGTALGYVKVWLMENFW